uniref:Uncharacterized protein n=1 Tax=Pseudomonas phage RVTF4 TaxID=3236931 RepID=A0AB39CDA4_9VIRU
MKIRPAITKVHLRNSIPFSDQRLEEIIRAEERLAQPVDVRVPEDQIANHIAMAGLSNIKPWERPWLRLQENMMQQRIDEETGVHAELNADGTYHYLSMDDLPMVGRGDYPYKITSTGDMYKFRADQYYSYNPYGVVPEDLRAPAFVSNNKCPEIIIDESASMPSDGKGALAVIWNIYALRSDLWAKGVRNWSYIDMLPKEERWRIQPHTSLEEQRSLYLRYSHKALANQLREIIRMKDVVQHPGEELKTTRREYLTALERLGVSLWSEKGMIGFKDHEFVVVFE